MTLSAIIDKLNQLIKSLPEPKSRCFHALLSMLCTVGGTQIRNLSSLGGNLCSAAPTSDVVPVLLAARSQITVSSASSGRRTLNLTQDFLPSYRKVSLASDEVLLSILIPYTTENDYCLAFAQNRRKDDDRAVVNVCYWLSFNNTNQNNNERVIEDIRIAYGGVTATTKLSTVTRAALIGRKWNEDIIPLSYDKLLEEYHIDVSAPGGMAQYREILICSFFLKFFSIISNTIKISWAAINTEPILDTLQRGSSRSIQVYNETSDEQSEHDTIGMPLPHKSALQHATGEAIFCDDNTPKNNELFAHVILSKRPHAKITSIDPSAALAMPGVVDCITHRDVPKNGSNNFGVNGDEFLFVTTEVQHVGQLIALVIAEDRITARKAAGMVKIVYEDLPAIFTIEEAIEQASFHSYDHSLSNGDTPLGFSQADHISTGEMHVGGQEHFYLETHSCIVTPESENNEVEIICGTQSVAHTQHSISTALGIPNNRVTVRCKRIGGGFGGKFSSINQLAACVSIASVKLKRPIRCQLEREDDMTWSGHRCPILAKYKVGYSNQGKLIALEMNIYTNSGYVQGDTKDGLDSAILHCCNVYHIPHLKIYGHLCKTNITRMVAMRGVTLPQVFIVIESMINNIASELKFAPHLIRKINFYGEELVSCCGVPVESDVIERCWDRLISEVDMDNLYKSISVFNSEHRYRKRGLCLIPVLFPLGFSEASNAYALVHIIKDGCVLLSHGGIEMGQGLYIKLIQVCAKALSIVPSKVHISETATNTIANANVSGGSFTSDNNGMAILDACRQLNERLMPIKKSKPDATWEEWISEAFNSKINLSAHGYYNYEGMSWNWKSGSGRPCLYYTYGAACSVVELDVLTGEHLVLKSDIVMDVGKSLNPAIDIGQIEGAFMQGVGLFTMEELLYLNTDYGDKVRGETLCRGPTKYKIPSIQNVPLEFNVRLLHNSNNIKSVYGSKGIGEPPLFLGSSIYFALLNAIQSARCDYETPPLLNYDSPLTVEKIRLACSDPIVKKVEQIHPIQGKHQKLCWMFTI